MAISNLASGLRTGVCTSSTRPTAPYNGQVIYETDSKQTLVYNGSAWVMLTDADQPPAMQLIKAESGVTATNASPYGVQSVFTSEFRNYRLVWYSSQATSNADLSLQFYTGTNTAVTSAVYAHGWGGAFTNSTPAYFFAGYSQTSPFAPATTLYLGSTVASSYTSNGWLDFYQPQTTVSTRWIGQAFTPYGGTYYNVTLHGGGSVETADQHTGFRFIPSAGTQTITYRLYGYRD